MAVGFANSGEGSADLIITRVRHSSSPLRKKKGFSGRFSSFLVLVVIVALITLVRFAFLEQLEYPLYYDSAVHYQIVDDLQRPSQSQGSVDEIWTLRSGRYYHLGFHSTVAVLTAQWGASDDAARLILVTGHVFLILLILNVGILGSKLFNNIYAGIVTILFAGLGWAMPAHAINWGKYPALASLAMFPLALYWMIKVYHPEDRHRRVPILFCVASTLCAILLHSRSLVLLACAVAAMASLHVIEKRLSRDQLVVLCWVEIGLLLLLARFHPNVQEVPLPYLKGIDFVATLLAVASVPVVIRQNAKIATGILTFTLCVAVISIIPMPEFLARRTGPYLFDRPLLQILLFVPLSLFIGGGFSYFMTKLRTSIPGTQWRRPIVSVGLVALTILLIMMRPVSGFKPNPCCVYMTIDDIFLIGWMEENVPQNSRILISTDPEINPPFVKVATDAGAWITPLTGLETIPFDYRADFSDVSLHNSFCQEDIKYIYVSAVNLSFSIPLMEENKQNYSPVFVLPDARLYQVNCQLLWGMAPHS